MTYWAHSRNATGIPQDLTAHLLNVAELARGFAAAFGAADLAHWAGLGHDLGELSSEFQPDLQDREQRRDGWHLGLRRTA